MRFSYMAILLLIGCIGCQEKQFQDQIGTDRQSTELMTSLEDEEKTSEPIMVGGAFLFCQAMETAASLDEHFIACRLQKDDVMVPVTADYQVEFSMDLETGERLPIEHRSYAESGRQDGQWAWFLTIAKNLPFLSLNLSLSHPHIDSPLQFESPPREQVLRPQPALEDELIVSDLSPETMMDDSLESPLAEAPPAEPVTLLLGDREFFILGDGALLASANPDCTASQLDAAMTMVNLEGVMAEKTFSFEVLSDQTRLDIEIPKFCGVSSRTDLDQHRISVSYPDGSVDEHLVPARANRLVLAVGKVLPAGRVTIQVQARNVATAGDIDDFLLWQPLIRADGPLRDLSE